jgi:RsiW-degrading membrane proteinase PrsW (M82 family)
LYTRRYYAHAEINLLLHTYILGFTVAALAVLLIETLIAVAAIVPLLWDQLSTLGDALLPKDGQPSSPKSAEEILALVQPTVGFYVLLFVLAYISAGCCEEGMKYVLATRVKRWTPNFRDREGFLLYAVAGALGFSTVENIGYSFNSLSPWYQALVGVVTRVLISTPIHLGCAYLVGVGVVRREVYGEPLPLWRVMVLPILLHGTFDFSLMIAAVNLDLDSVALLVVECVVVATTGVLIGLAIRQERKHIAADPPALLPTAMNVGQPVLNEGQVMDDRLLAVSA